MSKIYIDDLDLTLLTLLSNNGRKSYSDIAEELGVSAGTVRNRVARLVEQGTLSFIGNVDPNHVGFHAFATIHLRISPSNQIDHVVEQLLSFPEVGFLATVAGEFDLHVDVMCINNDHLNELLRERIHQIEGVVDTKTTMFLKVHRIKHPDLALLRKSGNGQ